MPLPRRVVPRSLVLRPVPGAGSRKTILQRGCESCVSARQAASSTWGEQTVSLRSWPPSRQVWEPGCRIGQSPRPGPVRADSTLRSARERSARAWWGEYVFSPTRLRALSESLCGDAGLQVRDRFPGPAGCFRTVRKLVVKSSKMLAFVALPLVMPRLRAGATCIPYLVLSCALSRYYDVCIVTLFPTNGKD